MESEHEAQKLGKVQFLKQELSFIPILCEQVEGWGKYYRWEACLIQALPFALKISAFPQSSRNKNMHVVLHV